MRKCIETKVLEKFKAKPTHTHAQTLLSPVMTMTRIPASRQSSSEARTSVRGGSSMPTTPRKIMSIYNTVSEGEREGER